MTLRASMLVLLIYGPPNLRRVTYIVSPQRGFLFTRAACATSTGAYRGVTSTSVSHVTEYPPSLKVRLAVNYRASKPEPMLLPCNRCSVWVLYNRLRSHRKRNSREGCWNTYLTTSIAKHVAMQSHAITRLLLITIVMTCCNDMTIGCIGHVQYFQHKRNKAQFYSFVFSLLLSMYHEE